MLKGKLQMVEGKARGTAREMVRGTAREMARRKADEWTKGYPY